jgi:hypothetical protein
LAGCGPGVVLRGGRVVRTVGLCGRAAVVELAVADVAASRAKRSLCRGWRDEWRELELGVCSVGASPSTEVMGSPSWTTSISSANDVGGETREAVGFEETETELASFISTDSARKTGGDAYNV